MLEIVLADNYDRVREGIRGLLENVPDFRVVGEASDGLQAVEITSQLQPDILVTDLKMPYFDGIEVTERVRQLSPKTGIIILSMFGDRVYVESAFKAGARGYVVKKLSVDGLAVAIRTVAAGEYYASPIEE